MNAVVRLTDGTQATDQQAAEIYSHVYRQQEGIINLSLEINKGLPCTAVGCMLSLSQYLTDKLHSTLLT